jgi:DNA mismatch endonuclease (patch repair protein)
MSRTGRRDTRPEVQLRRLLHARGLRYRVDQRVLAEVRRRADLVFPGARVVVFVDGCFWHGCPEHATWPKHNAEFWREKIRANQKRDRDTDQRLAVAGWQPVHVWEHEDPTEAADRVEQLIRGQRN